MECTEEGRALDGRLSDDSVWPCITVSALRCPSGIQKRTERGYPKPWAAEISMKQSVRTAAYLPSLSDVNVRDRNTSIISQWNIDSRTKRNFVLDVSDVSTKADLPLSNLKIGEYWLIIRRVQSRETKIRA